QYGAQRCGDLPRRKRSRRHLVQQRLEQMEIPPVDQSDVDRSAAQRLRGVQSAESAPKNYDEVHLLIGCTPLAADASYTPVMPRFFATLLVFCSGLLAADATYDGAKVHYESYGTGKEAIVFIHGWTCDLTFWRGQAPVYEKHRALLIDLPGHGQSEKPEVAYSQERFARAIDAVMRDAGVESAVLVGHSMGGPV